MGNTAQFKNTLRSIISEPLYELRGDSVFENIVLTWLSSEERLWGCASLLDVSRGFLRAMAPVFLMERASMKLGNIPDRRWIDSALSDVFSDTYKLNDIIFSVLSWGKFTVTLSMNETKISVNLSGLLHIAFWDFIFNELKAVFSCLRHGEKSEILKQIRIDDFQSGKALRDLFEKDAQALKNGNRNNEKLWKFLDRMEEFWAFTRDSFSVGRYL